MSESKTESEASWREVLCLPDWLGLPAERPPTSDWDFLPCSRMFLCSVSVTDDLQRLAAVAVPRTVNSVLCQSLGFWEPQAGGGIWASSGKFFLYSLPGLLLIGICSRHLLETGVHPITGPSLVLVRQAHNQSCAGDGRVVWRFLVPSHCLRGCEGLCKQNTVESLVHLWL